MSEFDRHASHRGGVRHGPAQVPVRDDERLQFLRSALDALSANIAILDESGIIVGVNASWRRFADENGMTWSDCGLGRSYLTVIQAAPGETDGTAQETATGMRELLSGRRERYSMEYPCHSPSQRRWFVMRATRFGSNGRNWVIVAHEDITARKLAAEDLRKSMESAKTANEALRREISERAQVERVLRRSEQHYALAQRAAHVGSWDWDIATGELYWSEQIEPMFGFSPGEFGATYEAFLECVHPEDRRRVMDAVNACVEKAKDYAIEHRIVWPDGTVRVVSETGDVIRDENGRAIRMAGIVQDITERRRAEEALRESEDKSRNLAAIVESSHDAIIGKSLDGTILSWNAGAERMYGYVAEEIVGRPVSVLSPAERPDEVIRILERLKRGEPVDHFETKRVRKDGREIHVSLNVSPIVDRAGQVIGASTIARDITTAKRAEQALREAKEAAEAARLEEQERRREAERRRRIAESLGDILTVLNSNQALDEVLDYIADQAGQLLGTRAAGIYRLESKTGALALQATRGLLLTYMGGADLPIGQGALRQAMASGEPVAVPDLASALREGEDLDADAERQDPAWSWAKVYRALLAVPIVIQSEIYGGMLLYYSEPRALSDEEVELAVAFADQVALAIGNARLREQVQLAATTAERDRIARDLHDAVTQTLFSAGLIAEAMPRVWEHDPEAGRQGLEELRNLTRGAAAEMRTMLLELRPAALTEKPLGESLRHLTEAMTGRARIPINLTVKGARALPADVQITLYRIAQEAINNLAKHARADRAWVDLYCQGSEVRLCIGDDGCGFEPQDVLPDRFGLKIMRERAEGVGATLSIESEPGQGTQVKVTWLSGGGGGPSGS